MINSDMKDEMREQVQRLTVDCFKVANKTGGDYAQVLKDSLDLKFGPTWHVIIGKSFGSDVMHEVFHYFQCQYGSWQVIAFKAGYL
uniref:Dynein light chain n=1 Tax=Trepomonas sp. PC1 TaxID=1076344 RepID=A0A146KC70_9EUKA|eukprot:JAP94363.1 Dynein light chain [Trepomonas sp. PC1]